ncbi:hypothetical protein K466DRAFT_667981 [Polyporus arcularius HHB13444]|uniref:F-box domain-containing protein n=1 Tax=Polyporus arcularius HHB13444 TaxID=1314778 RepID=A0A5C3P216_9APHY|nr:hypothetical protein K466DRAFT_667981 [Polyporus arcularius HHB13444]
MDGWKLHIDILLDVLSVADLKTMSQMVKTCRALHREGGKALLRSTDVELHTRLQTMSFLLFMHADASGRFPSLRALRLQPRGALFGPTDWDGTLLVGFFLELAGRCSGLKSLLIEGGYTHTDEWLSEELARAVSKLRSLTDLTLSLVHDVFWNPLRTAMLSHLLRADLTIPAPVPMPPTQVAIDLTHILEGSRYTLESITLMGSSRHKIVTRGGLVYPRLKTLDLHGAWIPTTADYITSFPALKSLMVSDYRISRLSDEVYASVRGENKRYQRARGSWPYMHCFLGNTQHLYLLGLSCHVHQVYLNNITEDVSAAMLRAVLDDVRPVDLELTSYANSNFLNSQWMEALCAPRRPRMTVLKIKIMLLSLTEEDSLEHAMVAIRAAVASLSLLGLCLYIERAGFTAETKGPGMYANIMDLDAIAQGFKDASPSLRSVLVELDCRSDRPYSMAWRGLAMTAADYWVPTEDPDRVPLAHEHDPPQPLASISPAMPNPLSRLFMALGPLSADLSRNYKPRPPVASHRYCSCDMSR